MLQNSIGYKHPPHGNEFRRGVLQRKKKRIHFRTLGRMFCSVQRVAKSNENEDLTQKVWLPDQFAWKQAHQKGGHTAARPHAQAHARGGLRGDVRGKECSRTKPVCACPARGLERRPSNARHRSEHAAPENLAFPTPALRSFGKARERDSFHLRPESPPPLDLEHHD